MQRPDFNRRPDAPERGRLLHQCGLLGCEHFMEVNTFQYPYKGMPDRSPEEEGLTPVQMGSLVRLEVMDETYRWHLEHDHEMTDQTAITTEVNRYLQHDRESLARSMMKSEARDRGQ